MFCKLRLRFDTHYAYLSPETNLKIHERGNELLNAWKSRPESKGI